MHGKLMHTAELMHGKLMHTAELMHGKLMHTAELMHGKLMHSALEIYRQTQKVELWRDTKNIIHNRECCWQS